MYNIQSYYDGIPKKFGSWTDLHEEDAVNILLERLTNYTEDDLIKILRSIPVGNYILIRKGQEDYRISRIL